MPKSVNKDKGILLERASTKIIDDFFTNTPNTPRKIGDKTYKTLRFNFSSSDPSLSKDKKLNTDIWYEEDTFLWVKAAFDKTGYWEYRLKKAE